MKRKRYSGSFSVWPLSVCGVATTLAIWRRLGVGRRCLYKWQAKLDHLELGEEAPRTNSHESSYRQQVHRLKRLLAEKTLEVDFFKGALQKSRLDARRLWRDGIYDQIREVMPLQGNLSIERMCELTRVSRAAFIDLFTSTAC